jgi:hypothetical protein
MMDKNKYKLYLIDLVSILKEEAFKAKEKSVIDSSNFDEGRLMAYYEFISLLKQQANAFGIDLEDINLKDFDEYKALLS